MSLVHENTTKIMGYHLGDMKMVGYDISFTLHQIVEPSNDLGWLLMNGASLSTTTYAGLFNIYGYTFGGSGANFSLPDFTDGIIPLPKGINNFASYGASTDPIINSTSHAGEITHPLVTGETGIHNHPDSFALSADSHSHVTSGSVGSADGSHVHYSVYYAATGTYGGSTGTIGGTVATGVASIYSDYQSHPHSFTSVSVSGNNSGNAPGLTGSISDAGSASPTAHNNMQPYQVMGGWLVKYK